jgi:Domain of unknown function (DUF4276)
VSPVWIGCVVEGHGDVLSVPTLIHRVVEQVDPTMQAVVPPPLRVKRSRILAGHDELQRALEKLIPMLRRPAGLFIMLDADDDCPAEVGPQLLKSATGVRSDVPFGVVFAKREFEAWFLAAAESVCGRCGLPANLEPPLDPEQIRDAKGWLRERMPPTRTYTATTDQLTLTRSFNLNIARQRSPSFDKCYREIERLLRLLASVSS